MREKQFFAPELQFDMRSTTTKMRKAEILPARVSSCALFPPRHTTFLEARMKPTRSLSSARCRTCSCANACRFLGALCVCLNSFCSASAANHSASLTGAQRNIDFARDVQPILATKCVRCHGPQTSEAGLRLDDGKTAVRLLESGNRAIVPGKPDESELVRRVTADPSE